MRLGAVILAVLLAAGAALAELNLTTNDNWQSIIMDATNETINLAAGVYAVTNTLIIRASPKVTNVVINGNVSTRDMRGVTSNGYPEVVITGSGTCRVAFVANPNFLFNGITFTGGWNDSSYGSAIAATAIGKRPTFIRCNIVSNITDYGAAAYYINFKDSSVSYNTTTNGWIGGANYCILTNCTIKSNSVTKATFDYGGLFTCIAYDSDIIGNYAADNSGGAYQGYLERCNVISNTCGDDYVGTYNTMTRDCVIEYNRGGDGAGSYGGSHTGTVWRYNVSNSKGGGTYSVSAWGCAIQSNTANTGYAGADGGTFYRCLFQGNYTTNPATTTGGGAGGTDTTVFYAYNCVFDGNYSRANYPQAFVLFHELRNCTIINHTTNGPLGSGWKSTSMVYNCVMYNNTSNYITTATDLVSNVTSDPLFITGTTNAYMPSSISPVIDVGNDTLAPAGNDYYNRTRITGLAVDAGAVEYHVGDEPTAITGKRKTLILTGGEL